MAYTPAMSFHSMCAAILAVALVGPGCSKNNAEPKSGPPAAGKAVPIPNARLHDGMLVGGQPSDEHLSQAAAAGYKTVISLRASDEPGAAGEGEKVADLGMSYVSIPVAGADAINRENAAKLAEALAAARGPIMVHCGSGNRVAALLALDAFYRGKKSAAEAVAIGEKAGLTKLKAKVEEILSAAEASQ